MSNQPKPILTLLTLALLLCAALVWACNDDTPPERIEVENFDRACQTANDCTLVAEETCLECTSCVRDDAISVDALDEFQREYDAVECDEMSMRNCNNGCSSVAFPICQNNECASFVSTAQPAEVTAIVSTDCSEDDDCAALHSSEPDRCPECCPDLAVNAKSLRTTLGPSCPADPELTEDCTRECGTTRAVCDEGTCVLAP